MIEEDDAPALVEALIAATELLEQATCNSMNPIERLAWNKRRDELFAKMDN